MDTIIDEALKLAGVGLLGLVMALVQRLLVRVNMQLSNERLGQLEALARQGILKAEEWAAGQIKGKLRDVVGGTEKREIAIRHVLDNAPGTLFKTAAGMVEAALPTTGLGALAGKQTPQQP
jgi:hypothetical protein